MDERALRSKRSSRAFIPPWSHVVPADLIRHWMAGSSRTRHPVGITACLRQDRNPSHPLKKRRQLRCASSLSERALAGVVPGSAQTGLVAMNHGLEGGRMESCCGFRGCPSIMLCTHLVRHSAPLRCRGAARAGAEILRSGLRQATTEALGRNLRCKSIALCPSRGVGGQGRGPRGGRSRWIEVNEAGLADTTRVRVGASIRILGTDLEGVSRMYGSAVAQAGYPRVVNGRIIRDQ